jgi:hypothetical protein
MIFIFGVRLFGKVDVVPGRFHVATEFYHIQFVPIVPMQTYLVLEEDGDGWQGVKIPLCRKSVTAAWLRTGLFRPGGGRGDPRTGRRRARRWRAVAEARRHRHGRGGDVRGEQVVKVLHHADCKRACELARLAGYRERGIEELRAEFADTGDDDSNGAADDEAGENPSAEPRMYFVSGRQRETGQDVCVDGLGQGRPARPLDHAPSAGSTSPTSNARCAERHPTINSRAPSSLSPCGRGQG